MLRRRPGPGFEVSLHVGDQLAVLVLVEGGDQWIALQIALPGTGQHGIGDPGARFEWYRTLHAGGQWQTDQRGEGPVHECAPYEFARDRVVVEADAAVAEHHLAHLVAIPMLPDTILSRTASV